MQSHAKIITWIIYVHVDKWLWTHRRSRGVITHKREEHVGVSGLSLSFMVLRAAKSYLKGCDLDWAQVEKPKGMLAVAAWKRESARTCVRTPRNFVTHAPGMRSPPLLSVTCIMDVSIWDYKVHINIWATSIPLWARAKSAMLSLSRKLRDYLANGITPDRICKYNHAATVVGKYRMIMRAEENGLQRDSITSRITYIMKFRNKNVFNVVNVHAPLSMLELKRTD